MKGRLSKEPPRQLGRKFKLGAAATAEALEEAVSPRLSGTGWLQIWSGVQAERVWPYSQGWILLSPAGTHVVL